MAKFKMSERLSQVAAHTSRLGAGSGAVNQIDDKEVGKFVKLVAESRHDLCAAGDAIEGYIESVEPATQDDFTIGGVRKNGYKTVIADGLQATPGTGTIAVGDYVVCGSVTAKGTVLPTKPKAKVCKATEQPGSVPADLTAAGKQARNAAYAWRVVSVATSGAVGEEIVIERQGI